MKKIIISGASGCIGMSLIKQHISVGNKVLVIANPVSIRNINFKKIEGIEIIYYSLNEYDNISLDNKYDVFYHFAWEGGASRDNLAINMNSAMQSRAAVNLAYRLGCSSFVGAGSQAECGIQQKPISENTNCNPESFFGIAKLSAYHICKVACNEKNILFSWARILSVYGPFDGKNTLVTSTINKLISGSLPEFSSGTQIWDFLFSEDAADALLNIGLKSKMGGIYIIASGIGLELKNFILQITKRFNIDGSKFLNKIPSNPKSVQFLVGDISRLKNEFNWTPKVNFEQGLEKTIKHLELKNQ